MNLDTVREPLYRSIRDRSGSQKHEAGHQIQRNGRRHHQKHPRLLTPRLNLDTVREMGTAKKKTLCARVIGLVPLALARLNLDTVREVGIEENAAFYARAGLNPVTSREIGTGENAAFYARGIGPRLNLDTVREVGIEENAAFYARAGLNPVTSREIGTGENAAFYARGIGLSPLALVCGRRYLLFHPRLWKVIPFCFILVYGRLQGTFPTGKMDYSSYPHSLIMAGSTLHKIHHFQFPPPTSDS